MHYNKVYPQFTKLVDNPTGDNYVQFVVSGSGVTSATGDAWYDSKPLEINYSKQPTETNRGDFEERFKPKRTLSENFF